MAKAIKTTSGNAGIKDLKVFIGDNYTFTDYLEIMKNASENEELYNELFTQEMYEMGKEWDWEQAFETGTPIEKVWEERDWFELQVERAIEDGNLEKFGEY